jgi:hypothetical protein
MQVAGQWKKVAGQWKETGIMAMTRKKDSQEKRQRE